MVNVSQIFGPFPKWVAGGFNKLGPILGEKKRVNGGFDEVIQLVAWDNERVQRGRLDWKNRSQLVMLEFGCYYQRTIKTSGRGSLQGRSIATCGWRMIKFSCWIEQ